MRIVNSELRFNNNKVYHAGDKPIAADIVFADGKTFQQKLDEGSLKGQDGTSVSILGEVDSIDKLPVSGVKGDAWLINEMLYVWDVTNKKWAEAGNIRGPQGSAGPMGPKGDSGPKGEVGPRGEKGIQGYLGNSGEEYPLTRINIDGVKDETMNSFLKDVLLDVQVINANPNKIYQIAWIGNGYTGYGDVARFGFVIVDYDRATIETEAASTKRVQQSYSDVNYDRPSGIVTRFISGRLDNVKFIITIDYDKFGANTFISSYAIGTSVIHDSKYIINTATGLLAEKTLDYPLLAFDSSAVATHKDLQSAILDVKVFNANPNKLYRIEWIGNGTTSWGAPEYAVYLTEYDKNLLNPRIIFTRSQHLDAPKSSIETRVITKDAEDIVLSITINYAKLSSDRYPLNTPNGAGWRYIIDPTCYYIAQPQIVTPPPTPVVGNTAVYYRGEQDILVKMPYLEGVTNAVVRFGQLGINKITHVKNFYYKRENKMTLSFDGLEDKYEVLSDWLSPYGMKATNNPINTSGITVGGNHGTDSGNGFPTAHSVRTRVFADGVELKVGDTVGAWDCVEILTVNRVSASNVIDTTTGYRDRDSAEETVLWKIYKDTMYVTVTLGALENITMTRYTGMQLTAPPLSMQDKLYFMTENTFNDYVVTNYTGKEILSCKKSEGELDRFVYYGVNDAIICYRDSSVGISDFSLIKDEDTPIYKSSSTKVYMHNISQKVATTKSIAAGDSLFWAGGYTFTSTGLKCPGAKKAYTIRQRGKKVYVIDFDKATANTVLETHIEDRGKFINVISKSPTVSCSDYITSTGLAVTSTGFGQLKFTVE